ncbi:MAG: hypothetical protein J5I50_08750 [Chitinophagaceae bacterium]|nr:hypothetical protein [Chitinophagaceae bacterium]
MFPSEDGTTPSCSEDEGNIILSEEEGEQEAQIQSVRNYQARVTLRLTPPPVHS